MFGRLQIAYFAHSLRSDWNNGNAHFLRGLIRELSSLGHEVVVFEPCLEWSLENLLEELGGEAALMQFQETYPELQIRLYETTKLADCAVWRKQLKEFDIVVMHEWNPAALAHMLLKLRAELGYRLMFHDTHHRASSCPEQIRHLGIDSFDGVVAFGKALTDIYKNHFGMRSVWTLHEAADVEVFQPHDGKEKQQDVVWIGNWGEEERSREIREFILQPAGAMQNKSFAIYGVRYPKQALKELCTARVRYGGYLPNLEAPSIYATSRVTVHVPRQQYVQAMTGIPTIRVFEALACGIPLLSAPWTDTEGLFHKDDLTFVSNGRQMCDAIKRLLERPDEAEDQARHGRETVLSRHTCAHRAAEFEEICWEVLH